MINNKFNGLIIIKILTFLVVYKYLGLLMHPKSLKLMLKKLYLMVAYCCQDIKNNLKILFTPVTIFKIIISAICCYIINK